MKKSIVILIFTIYVLRNVGAFTLRRPFFLIFTKLNRRIKVTLNVSAVGELPSAVVRSLESIIANVTVSHVTCILTHNL